MHCGRAAWFKLLILNNYITSNSELRRRQDYCAFNTVHFSTQRWGICPHLDINTSEYEGVWPKPKDRHTPDISINKGTATLYGCLWCSTATERAIVFARCLKAVTWSLGVTDVTDQSDIFLNDFGKYGSFYILQKFKVGHKVRSKIASQTWDLCGTAHRRINFRPKNESLTMGMLPYKLPLVVIEVT